MRPARLIKLAWKSIWLHKLRSFLTVLGIVCGAASVIAMLAVGEGESQKAQAQIRQLGSSNILLASVPPPSAGEGSEANQRVLRYGLRETDYESIRQTIPDVEIVVARRDVPERARFGGRRYRVTLMGTSPAYLDVANLRMRLGRFLTTADQHNHRPVCVLGSTVAERLFDRRDPRGLHVHLGRNGYRVIGVLAGQGEGTGSTAGLGGESDSAIFIPRATMRERYGNIIQDRSSGSTVREDVQLHRITVRARSDDEQTVSRLASALRRLIAVNHPKDDVRLTVPLELLRQARETKERWTLVLAIIASISLLVGGVGIMNIMLATVVERTREIGVRRALGARKRHIVSQFLTETLMLSLVGGGLGVAAGIFVPKLITNLWGMDTIVNPWFLGLAFLICAALGVLFGLYPAVRAASLDPVEALRHE